jgi:hypothetical protein
VAGADNLKPFKKGDPRINRGGRPRAFDELRAIAKKIAEEKISARIGETSVQMTRAEAILRQWAGSKNPISQQNFIVAAFGKVPDEVIINPQSTVTLKVRYAGKSNGSNGNGSGE